MHLTYSRGDVYGFFPSSPLPPPLPLPLKDAHLGTYTLGRNCNEKKKYLSKRAQFSLVVPSVPCSILLAVTKRTPRWSRIIIAISERLPGFNYPAQAPRGFGTRRFLIWSHPVSVPLKNVSTAVRCLWQRKLAPPTAAPSHHTCSAASAQASTAGPHISQEGQLLLVAHSNTSIAPTSAAASSTRESHGQPLSRSHLRVSRSEFLAAAAQVRRSQGQPSSNRKHSISRFPTPAAALRGDGTRDTERGQRGMRNVETSNTVRGTWKQGTRTRGTRNTMQHTSSSWYV